MRQTMASLAAQVLAIQAENRALREDLARMRERVAVLEARPAYAPLTLPVAPHIGDPPTWRWQPPGPYWVHPSPDAAPALNPRWWEVTCGSEVRA